MRGERKREVTELESGRECESVTEFVPRFVVATIAVAIFERRISEKLKQP